MKPTIHRIAYCSLLAIAIATNAIAADFVHPGIAHRQQSIDFVKAKIAAGEEPWATAWKGVQASRSAELDWRPQPRPHVERGPYNNPNMGLDFLACTCEIAWNQGKDLYGSFDNRLLKGFEYTAKYNLGEEVPFEDYESYQGRYKHKKISGDSRGRLRPMYEKVFNHYQNRKGMKAEFTKRAALKLRENSSERRGRSRGRSRSRSSAIDTLMFAGQRAKK